MRLSLVLAALCLPVCAAAQHSTTFIADVADAATGAPLKNADVILEDIPRVAHTNWLGEARFTDVEDGKHRVRVRKFGYVAADLELPFQGDSVGQVFMLAEAPHGLDTVRVMGQRVPANLQAFEQRRATGVGMYLTEDQLNTEGTKDFRTVAITRFPGLILRRDPSGQEELYSIRSNGNAGACGVAVYLDDIPIPQKDVWDFVRTWDLAGVEFYDGTNAPIRYRLNNQTCGVLLLWSREY